MHATQLSIGSCVLLLAACASTRLTVSGAPVFGDVRMLSVPEIQSAAAHRLAADSQSAPHTHLHHQQQHSVPELSRARTILFHSTCRQARRRSLALHRTHCDGVARLGLTNR